LDDINDKQTALASSYPGEQVLTMQTAQYIKLEV